MHLLLSLLLEIIFPLVGAGVGVFAAVYAYLINVRQRRAEEALTGKLRKDLGYREFLKHRRNLLVHASRGTMSEDEVEELIHAMDEELASLEKQDREHIEEALYQPSVKGRSNYAAKLVEESVRVPMNIDDLERSLRDAVERGVLNEATVNEAVLRWRQADKKLDEAQVARQDRDEKIADALIEYNEATGEIGTLYNTAHR